MDLDICVIHCLVVSERKETCKKFSDFHPFVRNVACKENELIKNKNISSTTI